MSQKQVKGKRKEGKGGDASVKVDGNTWEGFKRMWMECVNE